jgi:hypothetical protein
VDKLSCSSGVSVTSMRFLAIGPPFGERMPRTPQNLKTFLKDHLVL